jgi:hypothetical protein
VLYGTSLVSLLHNDDLLDCAVAGPYLHKVDSALEEYLNVLATTNRPGYSSLPQGTRRNIFSMNPAFEIELSLFETSRLLFSAVESKHH